MLLLGKHRPWGSFLTNNSNIELLGFAYYSNSCQRCRVFVSASGMLCAEVVCLKCMPGASALRCRVPHKALFGFESVLAWGADEWAPWGTAGTAEGSLRSHCPTESGMGLPGSWWGRDLWWVCEATWWTELEGKRVPKGKTPAGHLPLL